MKDIKFMVYLFVSWVLGVSIGYFVGSWAVLFGGVS